VKRKITFPFLFPQTFFGLTDKHAEHIYEELFFLKQHGGWSFIESYNLPMQLRKWWIERIVKQMEEEAEAMKKSSKSK